MKVIIAGDFCPRGRVLTRINADRTDSIFSGVKSYIEDSDLAIVNFECPIIKGEMTPISKNGPSLCCPEESINMIRNAGFKLVTLANNHFYDQGEAGVVDTITTLVSNGIDYVGGGINIDEASNTYYYEKDEQRVAILNCCEHEFSIATEKKGGSNPLNPIRQWYQIQEARKNADYVIVIVHGGHEHYNLPSPRMKEIYRFFIDSGADAVVNHHQHCYSGYEIYSQKPIFYGLGNFCMDDPRYRNSKWNEGFMVQLIFDESIKFELFPFVQGDETEDVLPMKRAKYDEFYQTIQNLNAIIEDEDKLYEAYYLWVEKTSAYSLLAFMPYFNKILRHLAIKGILPSKPSKKRMLSLLNRIECESHRERLLFQLKKNI